MEGRCHSVHVGKRTKRCRLRAQETFFSNFALSAYFFFWFLQSVIFFFCASASVSAINISVNSKQPTETERKAPQTTFLGPLIIIFVFSNQKFSQSFLRFSLRKIVSFQKQIREKPLCVFDFTLLCLFFSWTVCLNNQCLSLLSISKSLSLFFLSLSLSKRKQTWATKTVSAPRYLFCFMAIEVFASSNLD